jgi:Prenyltransferase and squalene oxidase repeat
VRAVAAYCNPDGGFGHALEPDLRSPSSQPAAVQQALELLAEVDALDEPMVSRACAFLLAIQRPDGGIPFVLPTVGDDPRAPWWQPADASSLTQTAANAAVLHRGGVEHAWLDGATAYCWARIEEPIDSAYDALYAVAFLDAVPDRERAEAKLDALWPRLRDAGLVATDPDAPGEGHTLLDLSPRPDARSRRLFAPDLIDRHLDALAAGQQDDGGWTFAWPAWCAAAAHEWRGHLTVNALKVLRANGRLG